MKIANPNQSMPYAEVTQDAQGNDAWGTRIVDGLEEIVNLQTGESNMSYHTPEVVTHYENCDHKFKIVNVGIREIECLNPVCRLTTSFHPAVNYEEINGTPYVTLNNHGYEIIL